MKRTPMRRLGTRGMAILCLIGFAVSVKIHLDSYLSDMMSMSPEFFYLQVGGMLVIPATVAIIGQTRPGELAVKPPTVLARLSIVLILYTLLICYLCLVRYNEMGAPYQEGERHVLRVHGRLIRELSREEYAWQVSYQSRAFSAFWMSLYFWFGAAAYAAGWRMYGSDRRPSGHKESVERRS